VSDTGVKVSPWDLMQKFDEARFGADIFDPDNQRRWSHAMFIGGLPYMWRHLAAPILKMIYDLAEVKPGDKVLLFGESLESCGFISDLQELVGPTGEVRPIDMQEDARNAVSARRRGAGGMIGTFSYDYTSDIPDSAYDIVINLQGIQHAEDWTAAGKEFLRVMKSGRRLVMAEIVLGAPQQIWKIESDLHIQHLFDKIFSRRNVSFDELPYYSPDDLKKAFSGLLTEMSTFEWRGLEVFSGRKP
jgi:SAM-dependent methyltransferase